MINSKLELKVPSFEDLEYRKNLLSDIKTMNYNKGLHEFDGYDSKTGCIDFDKNKWSNWFKKWINNTPDRYYAYIIKTDENIPIGDVALYYDDEKEGYCVSIVIESKYRCKGYGEEALRLLIDTAFCNLNANKIFDNFPKTRVSAEKLFINLGFKRISDEIVELTKIDYLNL